MSLHGPRSVWRSKRDAKVAKVSSGSKNLLELLSSLNVPDGALAVFLAFISALSLAPYLGGRALWVLGGSPVVIPTLSEQQFWTFVIMMPYMWVLAIARVFYAAKIKLLYSMVCASLVSLGAVVLHSANPTIGLTAMDSSFLEEYEISAWYLTASHQGEEYKYFRSTPISLGIAEGCALRVERIEVLGRGWVTIEKLMSGFDIQVFVSTSSLLPQTFKSQQDPLNSETVGSSLINMVRLEPINAEVQGRAAVEVKGEDLAGVEDRINLDITYDFSARTATVKPGQYAKKKLERRDIVARDSGASVQLVGWTLYGDNVALTINDPIIRVSGKVHCPFIIWVGQKAITEM
ncbi:membrane hypothetical protein [Pseudomonas chlororaphis]